MKTWMAKQEIMNHRGLVGPVVVEDEVEFEFLESYLKIQQIRFPERLRVEITVDPEVREAMVPNLVLQPLVENAITHGISQHPEAGRIQVQATREDDQLILTVRDDGPGLPVEPAEGVGISNTRARLTQLYPKTAELTFFSEAGAGTMAIIRLPLRRSSKGSAQIPQSMTPRQTLE